MKPLAHQIAPIKAALDYLNNPKDTKPGIIVGPTACHAKGYRVFTHDRKLVRVEDVRTGDILLGNDLSPRKVLELHSGREKMFKVTIPYTGISFRVNKHHILHVMNHESYGEITVEDYLQIPPHLSKQLELEVIRFETRLLQKNIRNSDITGRRFLRFEVEEAEEDDFYGFTLDGNHLYIDENHVVQHNCGKSYIISSIANQFDGPVLVLQPSQELLEQNIEKLFILGGEATIYSASLNSKTVSKLTYATLGSVKVAVDELKAMGVKTVLIDECHATFAPDENSQFSIFMRKLAPTKVIGLTATPFRLKSSMEGSELKLLTRMRPNYFKQFLSIIQIQEIVETGYWSRIDYERHQFDETGLEINTSGSDYSEDSIREAIKVQGINNNIYLRTKQLLRDGVPSILVFVDSVENAETMAKSIKGAACVHGKTNKKDRSKRIQDFKSGKIKVMVNVGVLTTGFDYPDLRCIIMGRPTMSLALYYQIIGRGTRISPATGKESCLYIDYCNNVDRFGRIENLRLEEVAGWGYGIFSNNLLLTNTPIAGLRKTKEDILRKLHGKMEKVEKIWFGAHNGKAIEDLPIPYIKFILFETGWDFGSPKMKSLQLQLKAVLAKQEQRSLF